MTDDLDELGPIDYVVIEFPGSRMTGEVPDGRNYLLARVPITIPRSSSPGRIEIRAETR